MCGLSPTHAQRIGVSLERTADLGLAIPAFSPYVLAERNSALVLLQPLIKGLERGIERSRESEIASPTEDIIKIMFELEHVSQILGARKLKFSIHLERHCAVSDGLPQCLGHGCGHFSTG